MSILNIIRDRHYHFLYKSQHLFYCCTYWFDVLYAYCDVVCECRQQPKKTPPTKETSLLAYNVYLCIGFPFAMTIGMHSEDIFIAGR